MGRLHTCYAPVRRSPSNQASLINAAPRLACVKPIASVHPEPGSNSSLFYFLASFASLKFNGQVFSFPLYYISLFHLFKELLRSDFVYPRSFAAVFLSKADAKVDLFILPTKYFAIFFQIIFYYYEYQRVILLLSYSISGFTRYFRAIYLVF